MKGLTLLCAYQLAGEAIVRLLHAPIPGPVAGMVLLLLALHAQHEVPSDLQQTAQGLLRFLPVLFVPIGVGLMANSDRLATEWMPIAGAIVLSTIVTLLATALAMRLLLHHRRQDAKAVRRG